MARDVHGILFDKDGVLFDFQATWGAWALNAINHMAAGDADLRRRLAQRLRYDIPTRRFLPESFVIAGTAQEVSRAFAAEMPNRSLAEIHGTLVAMASSAPLVAAVPLRPLLITLRERRLKLGMATNDAEIAARAHLTAENALDLFDFVAGSDSGFGAKPAPGMCLAFADRLGLDPDACVMVGDSRHDMEAGRAAGFLCVGVLTGVATETDLAPHADTVLPAIDTLPAWLAARSSH